MRLLPAPSAPLTAILSRRVVARARSRPATFAPAIRSTQPTAPSTSSSGVRTLPTSPPWRGRAVKLTPAFVSGKRSFEAAAQGTELVSAAGSVASAPWRRPRTRTYALFFRPCRAGRREIVAAVQQRSRGRVRPDSQARLHDADHGVRHSIEQNRSADYTRIGAEPLLPQRVADHHDAFLAGLVFFAMGRLARTGRTWNTSKNTALTTAPSSSRLASSRQRHITLEDSGQVPERLCLLFAQAHEVRRRQTAVTPPALDERIEHEQPVRVVEWERSQEDSVDDAQRSTSSARCRERA